MKIGIVCYPTFGGSGVVATELGKALAEKGNQVHFITYSQPVKLDIFSENIFYHEVTVSDYPLFEYPPYELVLASKLVDVVKYEKLDLLHVHYAIPHASAAYMAKQILAAEGIYIPVVTTLHGTDITLVGKDASFEPVITFAINQSDAVTAVSESLKKDTFQHFKIYKPIHVVPNFINLDEYTSEVNISAKKKYAPGGEKIMIHVSNFRAVKRVDDVIRIFYEVRKQMPVKLLLVGDGPERYKCESLCRELGTCSDITFLGKVKAVDQVLSIADLFVLPSETESFGLAALEAMASGVPVVSSNAGGIPEVNEHGYSGFLSPVGDIKGMASNCLSILSDEIALEKFKKNALHQAQKFKIENILPMYEEIYFAVLASSSK
jgi:L-malate glycosyltransferase